MPTELTGSPHKICSLSGLFGARVVQNSNVSKPADVVLQWLKIHTTVQNIQHGIESIVFSNSGINCNANRSAFPYYSSWHHMQVRLITDAIYTNVGFFGEYKSHHFDIKEDLFQQIDFKSKYTKLHCQQGQTEIPSNPGAKAIFVAI